MLNIQIEYQILLTKVELSADSDAAVKSGAGGRGRLMRRASKQQALVATDSETESESHEAKLTVGFCYTNLQRAGCCTMPRANIYAGTKTFGNNDSGEVGRCYTSDTSQSDDHMCSVYGDMTANTPWDQYKNEDSSTNGGEAFRWEKRVFACGGMSLGSYTAGQTTS